MKIKMLKTKKGSIDGCTVNTYLAGQDYDMPESLADVFINQIHVAEKVVTKFIYVDLPLSNDIEVSEQAKIEVPQKSVMETPMKTIKKPGKLKGSKKRKKR